MSMLNVFIEADRVRLVMDRAFYYADAPDVLRGLYDHPKARISDNALFVIAGRGATSVIRQVQDIVSAASCVDTAIAEIEEWFAAEPDAVPHYSEGEEIVVAGVTLDGQVKAYLWQVAGHAAVPEVRQIDSTILRPSPPDGATLPTEWTEARIMAAARWMCTAPQRFQKNGRSVCGGAIDMWTCTATGVSLRQLGEVDISAMIDVQPGNGERYTARVAEG